MSDRLKRPISRSDLLYALLAAEKEGGTEEEIEKRKTSVANSMGFERKKEDNSCQQNKK